MRAFLSLAVLSLIAFSSCTVSKKEDSAGISRQEYDVYAAVIEKFADSTRNTYVAVKDTTLPSAAAARRPNQNGIVYWEEQGIPGQIAPSPWRAIPELWPEMDMASYRKICDSLNTHATYIVTDSIHTRYSIRAIAWDSLASRTTGLARAQLRGEFTAFYFSRAAIHPNGREALVYVEYEHEYMNAAGVWCWCTRVDGRWTIYKSFETWVT